MPIASLPEHSPGYLADDARGGVTVAVIDTGAVG